MSEPVMLALALALATGVAASPVIAFFLLAMRKAVGQVIAAVFGWFIISQSVSGEGSAVIQDHFRKKKAWFGSGASALWQMIFVHVRPEGARRHVFHRNVNNSNALLFHNGWPIFHLFLREPHGGRDDKYYYLRCTVNWLDVLRQVQADDRRHSCGNGMRYKVVRFYGFGADGTFDSGKKVGSEYGNSAMATPPGQPDDPWAWHPLDLSRSDIGPPSPPDPFRHLALGPEAQRVVRNAKFWLNQAEWYQEREMPWRWGCLLKGPPGTGKTSLARSIAQSLDLPIVIADLAGMSNRDLSEHLRRELANNTPCMLVLEDIDAVFNGRENVGQSSLTFDALLNFLDGVEGLDGVLTFVTTNRPETLDAALLRSGRLDDHVELPGLDAEGRLRIARLILQDETEAVTMAQAAPEKESPADFKGRCCRRAREILWASQ